MYLPDRLATAEQLDDPKAWWATASDGAALSMVLGNIEQVDELLALAADASRKLQMLFTQWNVAWHQAWRTHCRAT